MRTKSLLVLSFFVVSSFALAQDSANGGWRRIGDSGSAPAPDPNFQNQDANRPPEPQNYQVPSHLTIPPGTFVTVRINQYLSSDRNQEGDAFSASLVQPLVVDGVVLASAGQTIGGRVAEAKKAGRVEGTSRLGLQLTDLSLVDGQTVPIQTQLIDRNGRTSEGRDAAAIAGTTGLGALIGAAAGRGTGAAIGAGAGAGAGILGVLLTRGKPTIIGPESVLTFRIDQPVNVSTERAPQAFRYVDPNDYNRAPTLQTRRPPPPPAPYYGGYGYGYPYAYGYPYYGGGFYGPSFYFGSRFGYRRR
jgi:hypothetical protein